MQRTIQIARPHGPHLVCPPYLRIELELASEDPQPQHVVIDNDMVEALEQIKVHRTRYWTSLSIKITQLFFDCLVNVERSNSH